MGLWHKLASYSSVAQPQLGISGAALQGASLDELCQQAYETLEPVFRGKVNHFGIWLACESESNDSSISESLRGRFWADGREIDPTDFPMPQQHPPFPVSLITGGPALEQDLQLGHAAIATAATAGMRRALWVPVRFEQELHGVIFAAAKSPSAKFPRREIDRVAAELALVFAFRNQSAVAKTKTADLAEASKICKEICSGNSLDTILQNITDSCLQTADRRAPAACFATLGLLPEADAPSTSAALQADFRWHAGDNILARSAEGEPISSLWRKALESRSTVGTAMPLHSSYREISRIVAIPLLIASQARGVLVVGYHGSTASLASLQRLELRANMATAAIAISASRRARAGAADDSQFLLQSISDPVFLLNARKEIIHASEPAKALITTSPTPLTQIANSPAWDSALPISVAQVFKPAEWPRLSSWMEKIADSGAALSATGSAIPSANPVSHSIATELRTGRLVQLRAAPLPDGGFILFVAATLPKADTLATRPITELQAVLEWLDQGVLLFDENESLRAVNPRFTQLFGLDAEDIAAATNLRALVGVISRQVSDPPQFANRWRDAVRGIESSRRDEIHVVHPASRILERISRPVIDSSGVRLGRIEFYRDLTTQQLFQSKLQKSQHLASLGEKLSGVAHELSNPLTTILGYAQRLLRNSNPSRGHSAASPTHRDDIQRIFSEADRASSILRQLLASSRDSGPDRRDIDLNPLILRTMELQRFQLASEKIRLELDLSSALPHVLCDAGQLQQILMNLISNARHALLEEKAGGVICVRTRIADSGRVILEVSDSGPGIPEAHRHRIFDPFFTTKPSGLGTGLGLSIVMGLVRQNHGNIQVHSVAGQGARFSIDFPAQQVVPEVLAPVLPPALSSKPSPLASDRVLVVEDEPTVAQLIADMLSDLGYSSDVLHDARRAMVFALNRDYRLIICDMKMPGLDGQHLYRALVEAGSHLACKFLFVTGDVLGISTQEFLRSHRLPHIAKPFRMEEFADKLALVLAPASAASPPAAFTDLSHKNLLSHG